MSDYASHSDEALAAAANRGDSDAFAEIYRRYHEWVFRLAHRFTANHEDSLDVLQDTFSYLLKKIPHLTLTAKMTTFLYPVVRNISITKCRKRRRHSSDDFSLFLEPTTEAETNPNHLKSDLAVVLKTLPEPQREVLLMRFVDDMTLHEIATALQTPTGTVKSRLHNALKTLRDNPATQDYFEPQ